MLLNIHEEIVLTSNSVFRNKTLLKKVDAQTTDMVVEIITNVR